MRIIVQAKTSSSRLPGKSLLPIRGYPLAALALHRAAREGHEAVMATTIDPTDDALANYISSSGLHVMRGSEDDVLSRFLQASGDMADDDIIVRFTGDNAMPDADFAEALANDLDEKKCEIVGTVWPDSGLPFGLFGEAFRVRALRRAGSKKVSEYERLHVTPWIWRNCERSTFTKFLTEIDATDHRCCVANFVDYLRIKEIFEDIEDPVNVSWRELVARLTRIPESQRTGTRRASRVDKSAKFVLGTVQLGMPYGTLRKFALPTATQATSLLRKAALIGVHDFDTARGYELSEERLGDALTADLDGQRTIVTKLDPLAHVPEDAPEWAVRSAVQASVFASCRALRTKQLPVLLLHLATNRHAWNGAAWRCLLELRNQGIIGKLGVSVQSPAEAIQFIGDLDVEHMQLPINILDHRWRKLGVPEMFADRADIVVHARSVFLQGVLLRDNPADWPPQCAASAALIGWLQTLTKELKLESVAHLAVNYLRSLGWIDGLVIGIENEDQLVSNSRLFDTPLLSQESLERIEATRPVVEDWILDPSKW